MNSCPYLLIADGSIGSVQDLKGRTIACRAGPARGVPFAETFQRLAGLQVDRDVKLHLLGADQDAFKMLLDKKVEAALVPRPYGFVAEEQGFHRLTEWPDIVDDPLPISIETTEVLQRERSQDFAAFVAAHREGVHLAKANREKVITLLAGKFGHGRSLAERTFDDYMPWMNQTLLVDFQQFSRLLSQLVPNSAADARKIAAEWIVAGALKE